MAKNALTTSAHQIERFYAKRLPISKEPMLGGEHFDI